MTQYSCPDAMLPLALAQVARYLDHAGLAQGWLVLFDLRREVPWAEKFVIRPREVAGKRVQIVGC